MDRKVTKSIITAFALSLLLMGCAGSKRRENPQGAGTAQSPMLVEADDYQSFMNGNGLQDANSVAGVDAFCPTLEPSGNQMMLVVTPGACGSPAGQPWQFSVQQGNDGYYYIYSSSQSNAALGYITQYGSNPYAFNLDEFCSHEYKLSEQEGTGCQFVFDNSNAGNLTNILFPM